MENLSSTSDTPFNRMVLIVLDGAGIGAMPDAPEWGDGGSDTFGHILASRNVQGVEVTTADNLNTYQVLRPNKLLVTKSAFEKLENRLKD